ncbi:hypothetical protein JCM15548_11708 [Geofilum rubicundum JCM 15548]|uniref:Uncharacterized protein n=1 Tax=Geofilum rubicundum JCM 15548 TaxID=1236989 RepID=A0A0E9LXC6_9BACT|nr:hypothetical protein JCM15548_11708 [Geofilum rubicundum JCM 15548]
MHSLVHIKIKLILCDKTPIKNRVCFHKPNPVFALLSATPNNHESCGLKKL